MDLPTLVVWLIVGGVAGWLASIIMKGGGLKLTGNALVDDIITGIIGAVIGGWVLGALNIMPFTGMLAAIVTALIGAIILIFLLRMIRR
jgi:uncharacterized membrane protein YeaQ/YmgE (transglycosylase-associated protein family)